MSNLPTPEDVQYGQIITTEHIHDGVIGTYEVEVKRSVKVNSTTALHALIEALGHVNKKKTRLLTITVGTDKDFNLDRVAYQYTAIRDVLGRPKQSDHITKMNKTVDSDKH